MSNLNLIVIANNKDRVKSMNYHGFQGMTAAEVGGLLDAFDRAEQMTAYEFDAYDTLGNEECDRQGIQTLHNMFGKEWADAFFKRKKSLIARMQLEELYEERRSLTRLIDELEGEL